MDNFEPIFQTRNWGRNCSKSLLVENIQSLYPTKCEYKADNSKDIMSEDFYWTIIASKETSLDLGVCGVEVYIEDIHLYRADRENCWEKKKNRRLDFYIRNISGTAATKLALGFVSFMGSLMNHVKKISVCNVYTQITVLSSRIV